MSIRTVTGFALLALVAACSGPTSTSGPSPSATTTPVPTPAPTTSSAPPPLFPGDDWERAERPSDDFATWDRRLQESGSTCVAVIEDGRLVHEAYWNGGGPRVTRAAYSITKSVTAVLVGIAADDGVLSLDDKASKHLEQWRGTPSEDVTIRDLLANVSGRQWDYDTDYGRMIRRAPDKTGFSVGLGQDAAPGDTWVYNNSAVQTLEAILQRATGRDVVEFAAERLLRPLGMTDTTWANDESGNPTTYAGMFSSCLDLARFGLLMMHGGAWNGDQIVSKAFVDEATGRSSSTLNAGYGLLWWVNRPGRIVEVLRAAGFAEDIAPYEGQLAPAAPADTFWAYGYGSQYVAVIPSEGVVAVRMGPRPATPEQLSFARFTDGALDGIRASR